MMSVEFVYLACFISVHSFRQGFVLGTLGPQVTSLWISTAHPLSHPGEKDTFACKK